MEPLALPSTASPKVPKLSPIRSDDPAAICRTTLRKLGIKAKGDIQAEIVALQTPPNAPSTIRQKGSSNPLIDQGELLGAVTYKIEE